MSKKHYIAVAKMIASLPEDTRGYMSNWFAEFFARYSPRFDKARFLIACGVESKCHYSGCNNPPQCNLH